MNQAGCFQPGFQSVTFPAQQGEFAAGQGLMFPGTSSTLGAIEAAGAQFSISFAPLPAGSSPSQATTFVGYGSGLAVNAHSRPQNQAAAQAFIDFLARPAQNALFAKITGEISQYELLKGQLPAFMSPMKPVFASGAYTATPSNGWWNLGVSVALQQEGIGLITGQVSIDDILNAMDAAWKQGPA
jgi:raffinose/stachyose/melibiose transport system substrate-binding protein